MFDICLKAYLTHLCDADLHDTSPQLWDMYTILCDKSATLCHIYGAAVSYVYYSMWYVCVTRVITHRLFCWLECQVHW